jgi:hypothetical protein
MTMLKVFYFAAGFVVGIICLYLIETYSAYLSPNAELHGYPKKFGDVKITAFKSTDQQASKGIDKILMITKGEMPFFYASENKAGRVTEAAILGQEKQIRFVMFASDRSETGWANAVYAYGKNNLTMGDKFTDINFDGKFDEKEVYNDKGTKLTTYIYIDNNWKQADSGMDGEIKVGGIKYVFDAGAGWRQDDANSTNKLF